MNDNLKGVIDLFVYTCVNVFEGTRVVVCENCLIEMGHLENPFDVDRLAELSEQICGVCGYTG